MKRIISILSLALIINANVTAQNNLKKVYDEKADPIAQIDEAVKTASDKGKHVVCQVGGNWCIWCLRFADFITNDSTIAKTVRDNYEYIHVNYNPREDKTGKLMTRLDNCGRFGYPVLVVLDSSGKVIHIQDSSFLEEGKGYNKEKVLRFFNAWTPKAVKQ